MSERKYRPYTSVSDLSELRSALMTITLGSLMSFAISNVDRFAPNIRLNLKLEVMFERRLSTSEREPRGTWVSYVVRKYSCVSGSSLWRTFSYTGGGGVYVFVAGG